MILTATKIFKFDAAHFLTDYEGKCANMHGHTYKLEVSVRSYAKPQVSEAVSDIREEAKLCLTGGMVVDFGDLKKIVNSEVIDLFDHATLNDVFRKHGWDDFSTTAENIVMFIMGRLERPLSAIGIRITRLRLWETETCYATLGS